MSGPGSAARFTQLHLALAAATVFAAGYATTRADLTREPALACLRTAVAAPDAARALVSCTDAVQRDLAAAALAAPLALAALSALVAGLAAPALISWWFGVRPVDAPRLAELAALAGVRPRRWLVSTRRHRDAFTYHRGVVLTPPVTRALRRGDPVADAIVLHELGHVAHRDVGRTYRALVAPALFLPLVAVPFVVIAVERPAAAEYVARFAVLVAVVALTALAVVRAREHDADTRARGWDAAAFAAALRAAPRGRGVRWLATHPAARDAPARGTAVAAFTSGLVAAVAAVEATAAVYDLLPTPVREPGIASAAVSLLVGAVLSRAVRGHGWAVGLGLLVGSQLSPNAGPRLTVLFRTEAEPSWPVSLATAHPTALPLLVGGAVLAGVAAAAAARLPWPRAVLLGGLPLGAWLILLRAAAGDGDEPAFHAAALVWPVLAVSAGVALVAASTRPATAALGVAVAALALAAPTARPQRPPVPETTQTGYLCAWLADASPAPYPELAARFARADDPLTARIATTLLTDPVADTALARRCDLLLRYGRT